jgi:hypothetical protein
MTADTEATPTALALLPDRQSTRRDLQAVHEFQATVRELFVEGHDYGVIPNTGGKPALFKPGAEKLSKLLGLSDRYEIIERIEDWERPLFRYLIRCRLVHMGTESIVSEGLGECNSMESKYRWRWAWPSDVPEEQRKHLRTISGRTREINTKRGKTWQYRLDNDDIFSQVNTILKMAKKRALVDAALSAGRLSDLFTQDVEDFADDTANDSQVIEGEAREVPPDAAASKPPGKPPITSEHDPLWQRWQELCAEAVAWMVEPTDIPTLELPIPQDTLIAAGKTLSGKVEARKDATAREKLRAKAREMEMTDLQISGLLENQYGLGVNLTNCTREQAEAVLNLLETGGLPTSQQELPQ